MRELLRDNRLHILIGKVERLEMASDRSTLRVIVSIFPEKRQMVARMSWDAVGPNAGIYQIPTSGDLVLVAQAEGDEDQAFVIRRLSSKDDTIPAEATEGDLVLKALAGKATRAISDTAVYLSRPENIPTEPLVLGNVFKAMMSAFIQLTAEHKHIGNLGYYTVVPDNTLNMVALKVDPVDNGDILSDLAKTEK
jgi:hypothetical protein